MSPEALERKRARNREYMRRQRATPGWVAKRYARREYLREWCAANPERVRAYNRKHRYGITAEDTAALFEAQGGLCAVCREDKATDVDHDHVTNKVRGLLCGPCNRAIGLLGEEHAQAAADYLKG